MAPEIARARLLAWLAHGARDVSWALCSLPRERWLMEPPASLGAWSAARLIRHLALRETRVTLPWVRLALGDLSSDHLVGSADFQQSDAAWDPLPTEDLVSEHVQALADARFELLRRLEAAPDEVWERPLPAEVSNAVAGGSPGLAWLVARSYQHELEHLGALWRLVLYWDRTPPPAESSVSLPLQPADRLEESH